MAEQSNFDPNAIGAILSMLGKSAEHGSTQDAGLADGPKPSGDILSSILSNPEMLSKLPQILSVVQPLLSSLGPQATPVSVPAAPASVQPTVQSKAPDNRSALLYAMKPYLGAERREAIDYMVKLSKLGDLLKSL